MPTVKLGKIAFLRLQHEMVMVGHLAVNMTAPVEALAYLLE
ncbi:MAG TPA: hypothetical protein VIE65_00785 [Methylobacter sp.]|jgi:hypothetical protein